MAVHLAAGQGTRLRPVTDNKPKPLVELAGKSLLEHNVGTLRSVGIKEHVVVTGYRADQIVERGFDTIHNEVYDETEMIYSLFCAASAFPDDNDLVVSYGDIIYETSVAEALLDCDAPMCVVIDREWHDLWDRRFDDPLEDAETLTLDDGRIQEIGNEPEFDDEIEGQYIGLFKVRHDYVDRFVDAYRELERTADGYVSIESTAFVQRLVDDGWHVQAVEVENGWLEVDTLEDYKLYQNLIKFGTLSEFVSF
jgi:choline kinase